MLLGDVRDFVPEHPGELRLGLEEAKRAFGNVHQPARRGERVHAVGVEDDELPLQIGAGAGLCQHVSNQRNVLGQSGVLNHAEL